MILVLLSVLLMLELVETITIDITHKIIIIIVTKTVTQIDSETKMNNTYERKKKRNQLQSVIPHKGKNIEKD